MTKISGGTNVSSLVGTDEFPIYDGTASSKVATILDVGDYWALRALKGAKVSNSSTQAITTATWTELTWDTEQFDDGGYWASTPNPERLIVPSGEAGRHLIQTIVEFAASATSSIVGVRLKVNGTVIATAHLPNVNNGSFASAIQLLFGADLAADDYVTVEVWQNTGSNRNVSASPNTWLAMTKIGEA